MGEVESGMDHRGIERSTRRTAVAMVTEIILVLNGLTHAGLLFVLGSGLTLAFGLMRVVNLSHGGFYLLGGYLGLTVFRATGNWFLSLLAGGIGIACSGSSSRRCCSTACAGRRCPRRSSRSPCRSSSPT
jgi:branched-subunit amino acid ABC-type transport system permease component